MQQGTAVSSKYFTIVLEDFGEHIGGRRGFVGGRLFEQASLQHPAVDFVLRGKAHFFVERFSGGGCVELQSRDACVVEIFDRSLQQRCADAAISVVGVD